MDLRERDALIERLRQAIEQTRLAFEEAKAEYGRAIERGKDLGATHVDGSVGHATHVYAHALQNYRKALIAFNQLILDGKLPDEKDRTR